MDNVAPSTRSNGPISKAPAPLLRDKYRVGVLGAGTIAFNCHLPVLLNSAQASVAWVADRDSAKARSVARCFDVRHAELPDDVRQWPEADVVLVTVPYGARAPLYPGLSQRFPAIYVEKPLARSVAEHDRWCALWPDARFACGYQRRAAGSIRALREIVRTRLFGRLCGMRVEIGGPGIKTAGRYSSDLAMAGGGILMEVGVHPLDAALHVCDAISTDRIESRMERRHGFDIHTEARMRVRTRDNGEVGLDMLATSLEYSTNDIVFSFENATLTVAIFGDNALRVTPAAGGATFLLHGGPADLPRTSHQVFHEHWHDFFAALTTGLPNATSAVNSRITTQVVEQLYDSDG